MQNGFDNKLRVGAVDVNRHKTTILRYKNSLTLIKCEQNAIHSEKGSFSELVFLKLSALSFTPKGIALHRNQNSVLTES